MSKLLKLKEWLSVTDAAKYLSVVFGEDVTEGDVLRFALEGRLRLSVYFVNHANARCGKVVRYKEAELEAAVAIGNFPEDLEWATFPAELIDTVPGLRGVAKGKPMTYLMSLRIDEERYVTLGDEVRILEGVWDLPMVGGEQLDVEHKYQMLTGGPAVTLSNLDGALVEGNDGEICQLQMSHDDNEYFVGSKAKLERLKQSIANKEIGKEEAEKLLKQHEQDRKKFLEDRKSKPATENYHPAGGLPADSVLVVRTSAVREFEVRVTESTTKAESTRKTENLLMALTAIAMDDYGYVPKSSKSTAPKDIADALAKRGCSIDPRTIRGWLKEGAGLLEPSPKTD